VSLVANFDLTPATIAVFNAGVALTNNQTNTVPFPSVQLNQTGPILDFTISNTGGLPLTLTNISVPSNYALLTNAPATITNYPWSVPGVTNALATNGVFSVQLVTSNTGTFPGMVVITNDVTNFSFPVTGTVGAQAPEIQVFNGSTAITNGQTNAVIFSNAIQNQVGPIEAFTVTNPGSLGLNLTNITVPAGYTLLTNAPTNMAAGSNGTFSVQLSTNGLGTYAGNVTITNDAPTNNPFVFPVTGTVVGDTISLSGSLNFGVVKIGSSSNLTLTISNIGNVTLLITNITGPAGFTVALTDIPIPINSSQAVTVTFSPTAATNYAGVLTVLPTGTSGTNANTIPVSGIGANSNLFLTVITNGLGTVTPNLTTKPLVAGRKYTLTATARPDNVFSNWSGSSNSIRNALTFTMEAGTILEANFIPNPFLPVLGTYNGLFSATNGVIDEQTVGMLKGLTLRTKGTYSGTLLINGASHGLSGTFSLAGQATNTIKRPASQGGDLLVELTVLTLSNSPPQIRGTIYGTNLAGVPWVSTNLMADLATNLAFSSDYTVTIPPDTNSPASNGIPGGDGYALITNHVGALKITGALADGTAFSQSVPVSQGGDVPVYASLYGNKGLLLGWINLDTTNTNGPGTLNWVHPEQTKGQFLAAFTSTNPINFSLWTNPPAASSLPTDLVVLEMTNGVTTQTNTFVITVSNNYKLGEVSGPVPLSGSINPKTGLLTVTLGNGPSKQTGYGVVLPNATNTSGGYFVTKTNAGAIILKP
jgi:hypothetical protein